ncbi:MAG: glycosyltransferase [Actinomycetia bacterium]|nr:glycosyltransferase [Actinomycetes bacterium]
MYAWPEVRRGGERYLHELAGALALAGHDVRILTTGISAGGGEVRGVPVRRFRRHHLPRMGAQADEAAFGLQSLASLAAARIDVWHAMGTADGLAAAELSRVRGIRSVFTDHGFPNRASRERRPDHGVFQRLVRHVDRYVCVSEAAGAFLREGYGRTPDVLSGGVDVDRFQPGTREARPTLLFASDASESRKNLPLLLEAVAELRHRGVDVDLWVAGPGDQTAALAAAPPEAQAATTLLGSVDPEALIGLYGRAWVTVLPAHAEAFGLVLVESLACGTPIVALDEGGPREIVRPEVGALCPATAVDLARACEEAVALAANPSTTAICRDAAMAWDWRTSIVPRMETIYGGAA